MKPMLSASPRCLAALVALAGFHLPAEAPPAGGATEALPHQVRFELGDAGFASGDRITIQHVRGTSDKIAVGETYSVDGTYTLASREEADLAFHATTISNTGPTKIDARQHVQIKRGSGAFHLFKTLRDDGYLHVSFYASGDSFGGVYFGQGDRVFRRQTSGITPSLTGPNRVLLEYLGNPVEHPANMDARYTKEALVHTVLRAFENASGKIVLENIAVDDSEFPFLLMVRCGESSFPPLKDQLVKLPGYEYRGSVSGDECHVFSLVPSQAYPPEARRRIEHRLMLREAVFYEKLSSRE